MLLCKVTPQSLCKYQEKSVYFSKPHLVELYDYNYGNITKAKRMKYLKKPNSKIYPIDLNVGFETFVPRKSAMYRRDIKLNLKYDMTSAAERDGAEKTKVFTRRGTLVYIMKAYYIKSPDDLTIRVSRYNGNIYMVLEELDDSLLELKKNQTHHKRFEKLLFSDSPNKLPNIDEPCDPNIELVGIHRSNFGKYDIVYSGEIQGIDSSEEINDFDDLEALNNCRFVFSKQMWKGLHRDDNKFLYYWLQSYLANVEDVYIGYKSKNGFITEPIQYKITRDMPKNRYWKPSICTGFLYDFLQNVEKRMSSIDCPNTVFVFDFNWEEKIFSYEIFKGKSDKTFISEEYMEYCKK